MKTILCIAALAALPMSGRPALADEHAHPPVQAVANPTWDKMKTLVGNWEGVSQDGGKQFPAKATFRMVSGGSVLMNTLGEGTPYEMVTMFHLDLKDLLATHYCAARNQPRFRAVPSSTPNEITFEFKDGTNIGPDDGHMQRVVFTFVDPDHHVEDWTYRDKGKDSTGHFDFHRKR